MDTLPSTKCEAVLSGAAARQMQLIPAVVRATLLIVVAAAIMDRLACVQGGCIDGEGS